MEQIPSPAYLYYVPKYTSNGEWMQQQANPPQLTKQSSYLSDPLLKINEIGRLIDTLYAEYIYRRAQKEIKERGDTKTYLKNQKDYLDTFKNGFWTDYSGSERSFRTVTGSGKDKKVKYDLEAGLQNTLGNVSKIGGTVMSFIKDKDTANNSVNNVATAARKSFQQFGMQSGNPYVMAAAAISMLSDKIGGTASATKGLGGANDVGNFAASQIPFLGFAGKKMDKKFESDALKGSSTYNWKSTADGLYSQENGASRIVFGRGKADKITKHNNMLLATADNILTNEKLNLIGANDPRYYLAAQNELNGGYDLVGLGKNGIVLLFTKRTISKRNITKKLDGGQIEHKLTARTLDELVDYVEQKNPPFWKRMSGQNKDYIANDDGTTSSLRMTYSSKENSPFVDIYPQVQYDLNGNLRYYFDPIEAYKMAKLHNDVIKMTKEEAKLFTELYKNSSKLKDYYKNYYQTLVKLPKEDFEWEYRTVNGSIPENTPIEEYKEGGKVNVIPEGALHKNKHHLEDVDDKFGDGSITTKGIPVIVESEGGEVVQQAEVERQEIIFRLEVTKKLEELSKKHTDEAAIEAGKLLVKEILYNTEDNTGEML